MFGDLHGQVLRNMSGVCHLKEAIDVSSSRCHAGAMFAALARQTRRTPPTLHRWQGTGFDPDMCLLAVRRV